MYEIWAKNKNIFDLKPSKINNIESEAFEIKHKISNLVILFFLMDLRI